LSVTPPHVHILDRIPFITWFLLNYGTAALAIIAIMVLGVAGTISGEVISAILGSLIGYVLGATRRPGAPAPSITSFNPQTGAVGTVITVSGRGFGAQPGTVSSNATQASATDIRSWSDTEVQVQVPAGTPPDGVTISVVPQGGTAIQSSGQFPVT
jgi:IPT/TIG domain